LGAINPLASRIAGSFWKYKMANTKTEPLRRSEFGNAEHRFQRFDAIVPPQTTTEQLESPDLWVNVATSMRPGDEVRVRADDDSFVALLHVTYSVGTNIRLKLIYRAAMEEVDYDAMNEITSDYEIKLRGVKKWCVIHKTTGDVIKELIATQKEALTELDDLQKALRR
jgi:hypothetical protein